MNTHEHEAVTDAACIEAARMLYIAAMMEYLELFRIADRLAELFESGELPINGSAGAALYQYKKTAGDRLSEKQRRALYARALGLVVSGQVSAETNEAFDGLWRQFLDAVVLFAEQVEAHMPHSGPPVGQPELREAARALAANLSHHLSGRERRDAASLAHQLEQVTDIVSDYRMLEVYGARDLWQVVEKVAAAELGVKPPVDRYRSLAETGSEILSWLSERIAWLEDTEDVLSEERLLADPQPAACWLRVKRSDADLADACRRWLDAVEDAVEDADADADADAAEDTHA